MLNRFGVGASVLIDVVSGQRNASFNCMVVVLAVHGSMGHARRTRDYYFVSDTQKLFAFLSEDKRNEKASHVVGRMFVGIR